MRPKRGSGRLRLAVRAVSLGLFVFFTWRAAAPPLPGPEAAFFLKLDPVLVIGADLASRALVVSGAAALLVMVSAVLFGRVFCGWVCPLGLTLDAAAGLTGRRRPGPEEPRASEGWRRVKYGILAAVMAAALMGTTLFFWVSPLSLVTRLYVLVLDPVATLAARTGLDLARPVLDGLGLDPLAGSGEGGRQYATGLFLAAFFFALFALGYVLPRLWCRHLCPTGALLALCATRPATRRRVSAACSGCGACRRDCPMGAIAEHPRTTRHAECIVCRTCVDVCPEKAVSFPLPGRNTVPAASASPLALPSRRLFLVSGLVGIGAAGAVLTGLGQGAARSDAGGRPVSGELIRPPGALPEEDFLRRCVRCGACLRACPTNMLQPAWFEAGFSGAFSPLAVPRRGGCDPDCAACGAVCPTGAVRAISVEEKQWAKMGTAYVIRDRCLAWEWGKACLVCDEVCPYDAISFEREPGLPVAVPHVIEDRCAGCGFCMRHCPVTATSAIVVEPMNALRLASGSFKEAGRRQGLRIERRRVETPGELPADVLPPGFTQ